MKILIMGATGKAGSHAIQSLLAKGVRPTAAVRNMEKAKAKFGDSVDYVYFDYLAPSTYENAVKGVNRVFSIAPPPKKDPEVFQAVVNAAKKAGVELVLFQSGRTTGTYKGKELYRIEENLRNENMNYCIVRPGMYMQNFQAWMGATLDENEICLPAGEAKMALTDLQDLGEGIATLLTTDGHGGKEYNLTSEVALSFDRMADILSGAMGKVITYSRPDGDTYVNRMVEKGYDAGVAKYLVWLFARVQNGAEAEATSDFKNLTGNAPTSFAEFANRVFGN